MGKPPVSKLMDAMPAGDRLEEDCSRGNVSQHLAKRGRRARSNDYIYLVKPPKNRIEPPISRLVFQGLEYPRVIPLHAQADPKQFNDVMGKVRGKQLIELILTVPTVRLKYKKKEWTEETQFYLQIPFPLAIKLAEKMLRLSKKHIANRKRIMKMV